MYTSQYVFAGVRAFTKWSLCLWFSPILIQLLYHHHIKYTTRTISFLEEEVKHSLTSPANPNGSSLRTGLCIRMCSSSPHKNSHHRQPQPATNVCQVERTVRLYKLWSYFPNRILITGSQLGIFSFWTICSFIH